MTSNQRVAILGGGTVGSELVNLLHERSLPGVEVTGVLVRDGTRERTFAGWRDLVTTDPGFVDDADVVVEVMGGTQLAAELSLAALSRGARLVSANKAALAERWSEFLPFLSGGRVYLEAAVMAGTPVIGPLTGALRGSQPVALHAVLNGTCNVVLAAMDEGADYHEALADAQRAGFAEADPTLDVEGLDAAHKLTLLARLAFAPELQWQSVRAATKGISGISAATLAAARSRGRRVRLVGSVEFAGGWQAAVRPVELPEGHPLLASGPTNAMLFVGEQCGEVLVRGPGAGGASTASGVLGDLLAALSGRAGPTPLEVAAKAPSARFVAPRVGEPV
ncbi:MAG: homoserine dehydrogenase [Trueperaceae bacterium]